jgi:metallo-beta-lactamase class B
VTCSGWRRPGPRRDYDLEGKRERAETEGVKAWIDPEGYRRFIAEKKRAFEDQVDRELGVKKPQ